MIKLIHQTIYNRAQIKRILGPLLDQSTLFNNSPKPKNSILLKPNFVLAAEPGRAVTTHPDFYMAVAELLLERNFKVGIGESPSFGSCAGALRAHGVLDECLAKGIAIVEFKQPESYSGVTQDKHYQTLTIAAELKNWDAIINLPKLKVHRQFTFTAASKNLYGCVTGKRKFIRHNLCANNPVRFARMILANAAKANCILHIGDGIQAMHVKGPTTGEPFPLGKIIISDNHLVHDWLFCRLIDLEPLDTPLFQAVDQKILQQLEFSCRHITETDNFQVAKDFIHSPLIHISFTPWHMARSGWRTLKYNLGWAS